MKIKTILCKGFAILLFFFPIFMNISLMLGVYYSEIPEDIKTLNIISMGLVGMMFSMVYMTFMKDSILTLWTEE